MRRFVLHALAKRLEFRNLRVQHRFGGMWDTRNFKGGMRDENMTARLGYVLFRRRDTG